MTDNFELLDILGNTDKHSVVIGMTGSGKSIFSQYISQKISSLNRRIIYVSAKAESQDFYDKFQFEFEGTQKGIKNAIKTLLSKNPAPISLKLEYMDSMGLMDIIEAISEAGNRAISENIYFPITLIVDEVSLLVRHKLEASPATQSLGKAAATWRSFNLQLIVMSQRSSMIPQTVLTQANSIILFKFKQADVDSIKKVVGINLQKTYNFLNDNNYHFAEFLGEKEKVFAPINMEELYEYKEE